MSGLSGFLANQSAPSSQIANTGSGSGTGTAADLASGQSNIDTSYQTFLTLLTTQLQNQDPSSPMDPNTFTTELVQMTGVQQQLLSNQLLQQLVTASPSSGVSSAVNLIGKDVTATSSISNLTNGQASWTYNLPSTAATATVSVTNASGTVVFTGQAPSFAAGNAAFNWNGQDNNGVQQPDGVYTLSIAAADSSGGTITPTISVSGVAGSIQSAAGQTMVTIGNTAVPVSSITNVTSPSGS
jgi:flagellar basal-body rod modification protein FlgD